MMERLCGGDDMAPREARKFGVGRHKICLGRVDDGFYAIGDVCTHADVSLSEGEVFADTLEIECWKHGSSFSLETGEPNALPATKPEPVYQLEIVGGEVMVKIT